MTLTWLGILALAVVVLFGVMGFRRGFVREIVSAFFVIVSLTLVWVVNPYMNDFLREKTPVYEKIQTGCRELVAGKVEDQISLDSGEQEEFLEQLGLPSFITDGLLENNNAETYAYLAANTFADYVSDYLAVMVVNGLSFLLSYILVRALLWAVQTLLKLLTLLPVVHGVNKISGAAVGAAKGILFLWIALLAVTILCNTEIGKQAMALVEKDYFLSFLYSHDFLVKTFLNVFYGQ